MNKREILKEAKLQWKEFSEYHWRVHGLDYWPTKDKWSMQDGEIRFGIKELIKYLSYSQNSEHPIPRVLT